MFLGKRHDQGDVVNCARIAHAAPPLRRELAQLFTLRTGCHPENNCQLTLVVRSSGLILAFLNPSQRHRSARRQHGAPSPTRRANTARRCGRLGSPLVAQSATKAEETPVRSGVVGGNVDGVHTAVGVDVAWITHGSSRASLRQRLPLCVACVRMPQRISVHVHAYPRCMLLCMSSMHMQCLPRCRLL